MKWSVAIQIPPDFGVHKLSGEFCYTGSIESADTRIRYSPYMGLFGRRKASQSTPPIIPPPPPRQAVVPKVISSASTVEELNSYIRQLKREDRLEEAVAVIPQLLDAADREAVARKWTYPNVDHYQQAAITLRKLKRLEDEIAVLERFESFSFPYFADRLRTAKRELEERSENHASSCCPSCGLVLTENQRSGACKGCGTSLVIRRNAGATTVRIKSDVENEKIQKAVTKVRDQAMSAANLLDITDAQFIKAEQELITKWGSVQPRDVYVLVVNRLYIKSLKKNDIGTAIHCKSALANLYAEEGKSWLEAQRDVVQLGLQASIKEYGPNIPFVLRCCKCSECASQNQLRRTNGQALSNPGIPHENCESPPCRCSWGWDYDNLKG